MNALSKCDASQKFALPILATFGSVWDSLAKDPFKVNVCFKFVPGCAVYQVSSFINRFTYFWIFGFCVFILALFKSPRLSEWRYCFVSSPSHGDSTKSSLATRYLTSLCCDQRLLSLVWRNFALVYQRTPTAAIQMKVSVQLKDNWSTFALRKR